MRNQASVRVRGEQVRVKVAEVRLGSHMRAVGHLEFSVRQETEGKEGFELNPDAVWRGQQVVSIFGAGSAPTIQPPRCPSEVSQASPTLHCL